MTGQSNLISIQWYLSDRGSETSQSQPGLNGIGRSTIQTESHILHNFLKQLLVTNTNMATFIVPRCPVTILVSAFTITFLTSILNDISHLCSERLFLGVLFQGVFIFSQLLVKTENFVVVFNNKNFSVCKHQILLELSLLQCSFNAASILL